MGRVPGQWKSLAADRVASARPIVALPWFDSYFGVCAGASDRAIPGLLCGGDNDGVGVQFPDGTSVGSSPFCSARGLAVQPVTSEFTTRK